MRTPFRDIDPLGVLLILLFVGAVFWTVNLREHFPGWFAWLPVGAWFVLAVLLRFVLVCELCEPPKESQTNDGDY